MTDKPKLPELLAPAGSEESLRAALAAGADAVYFGHSAFSNRMRAKNFTDNSIRDAIKLCHDCGAAAHITVNTRIRDRETDEVLRLTEILLGGEPDSRADALIVADLGIARLIKDRYPHATLHASTQTSLMSPSDCAVLSELGFSRLVIPRELSYPEIAKLVRDASPMEIEMFIHGAHCVSLSGQCLMSYVQGGRSGNRGECAQPCRLPFSCADEGERDRLSLADMCLGGRITDVISSGVASLKIEGRLKSPTYVYGVTSVYRRLLDEGRNATQQDIRELESLFTRGFTDGYFTARYGKMSSTQVSGTSESAKASNISSAVSAAIKERTAEQRQRAKTAGKLPLRAVFALTSDAPATLTLYCGDTEVTAYGEIPSAADARPLTPDAAAKNLTKMGGTPFSLDENNIEFNIDDGLWMPLSAINSLRRDAVEALTSAVEKENRSSCPTFTPKASELPLPKRTEWIAEIADLDAFGDCRMIADSVERIIVPAHQAKTATEAVGTAKLVASLPTFTPDDGEVEKLLAYLRALGISRVLCHTVGQIRLAQKAGFIADMSYRANITSGGALEVYTDLGCASVALSPELPGGAMKTLGKGVSTTEIGCIAYGKIPVMTTARCLICGGKCKKGNLGGRISGERSPKPHSCRTYFTDRMGQSFPVIGQADCTNVIYNSTPIWMGDRLSEIERYDKRGFFLFMFTDETADEAADILEKYARGEKSAGRRV